MARSCGTCEFHIPSDPWPPICKECDKHGTKRPNWQDRLLPYWVKPDNAPAMSDEEFIHWIYLGAKGRMQKEFLPSGQAGKGSGSKSKRKRAKSTKQPLGVLNNQLYL